MSQPIGQGQRLTVAAAVLILLLPVAASGLGALDADQEPQEKPVGDSLTVISVQGGSLGQGSGVYIVDTASKATIWSHTGYFRKYFDVDPIDNETLLFTVQRTNSGRSFSAVLLNWRTDTIETTFPVPADTHDVDHIHGNRYLIADKSANEIDRPGDPSGHNIYIYDAANKSILWRWSFDRLFDEHANNTHVNDVDLVDNGSKILTSPRNLDQVLLIDRETKNVTWVLGDDNAYETLYAQHNPQLIKTNPPTVLVADSHNDRVVEYELRHEKWRPTWSYHGRMDWPRDADRLPNGNTLIVDTHRGRVIEVSPTGEVVWQYTTGVNPYDVERIELGDEPGGPRMSEVEGAISPGRDQAQDTFEQRLISAGDETYNLAKWILPQWVGRDEFVFLLLALLLSSGWLLLEALYALPQRLIRSLDGPLVAGRPVVVVGGLLAILAAGPIAFTVFARGERSGMWLGLGMALGLAGIHGVLTMGAGLGRRVNVDTTRVIVATKFLAGVSGIGVAAGLILAGLGGRSVLILYTTLALLNAVLAGQLLVSSIAD